MKPAKMEPKPRRSRYRSEEDYQKLMQDWEARKPYPVEVKPKGNSMTTKYYTEKLLPVLLKEIQLAKSAGRRAILQEGNDPSHGTTGKCDNLAKTFKLLKHPPQSPDLNPHQGIWNILKQRVRKRQWHTLEELKKVILEEWG